MASFFIINPVAGRGKALRIWHDLQQQLASSNIKYDYVFSQAPGHTTELATQAVAAGYTACIGVGGDGTLHEMVPALMNSTTALGCVPAGTGNDFARALSLPRHIPDIIALLASNYRHQIDVGLLNGRPFLNAASVGFDAVVADTTNKRFKKVHGVVPYLLSVFTTLKNFHNAPLEIFIDNKPAIRQRCLLVAAGNGQYYGGGLRICPKAELTDGLLDICIAGDLAKLDILATLPRLFTGSHISHPKCTYTRGCSMTITGPPLPVQADGQIVGTLPISLAIAPAAIWVLGKAV